jgi:hypothetical protein
MQCHLSSGCAVSARSGAFIGFPVNLLQTDKERKLHYFLKIQNEIKESISRNDQESLPQNAFKLKYGL